VELDPGRLKDLEVFSQQELEEIGRGSIDAISDQLEEIDRALAQQQLMAAGDAAHQARNEALLVGARELGQALQSLEAAARSGRAAEVRKAAVAARALWPQTREAIARATYRATG
jgi:HPt (histidine-containing phosphotransfer) domain-containing protein